MSKRSIQRALISVYDKKGIVEFARGLTDLGIEILSTGGTAATLQAQHLPVTLVENITGHAEMLDGRVKTLHPSIHAAILADRSNPEHMRQLQEQGIKPIDMVVVNLYPFEKTVADSASTSAQIVEMIDIGGPCLLRAAAKNHEHVLVVSDPGSYAWVLECLKGEWGQVDRAALQRESARGAFWMTTAYDGEVAAWLSRNAAAGRADAGVLRLWSRGALRYGENPHQSGQLVDLCGDPRCGILAAAEVDSGTDRAMSFNNFLDANAALETCAELTRAYCGPDLKACVFVKHGNPCGSALAADPLEAYRKAYLGDPNAAMGGVLGTNFPITAEFADAVMNSLSRWGKAAGAGAFFVEVCLAPTFDAEAVEIVRTRKAWGQRARLLAVGALHEPVDVHEKDYKKIAGALLVQTRDWVGVNEADWQVVTRRHPTDSEWADLRLAWLICKHTKSNAITICGDGMLLGNGAGQMSRVMSCRIASWLAHENGHQQRMTGAVAASDAFFPFRDGPDILMDAGVKALIQPGGSKRDAETIDACDQRGVAMVVTGTRHFKH